MSKRQERKLARFYARHGGEEKVKADLAQIEIEMLRERQARKARHGFKLSEQDAARLKELEAKQSAD